MSPPGYRMPAEWEPHRSTWLAWPKNKTTWPGKLLKEVEHIYLQMISALLPHEKVNLLVDNQKTAKRILDLLSKKKAASRNLIFHQVKTIDTWIRDYGPLFVVPRHSERAKRVKNLMMRFLPVRQAGFADAQDDMGDVAFTKWIFNAWGGKYGDLARDNQVVNKINSLKKIKRFNPGIILEGGSIDTNGLGTCLTTEQCLLNPNRNARLLKKEIEKYLENYLGMVKVIWLKEGIEGDDTDGHVDDITRFVGPRTVLTTTENDFSDKNHAILKRNLEILKLESDQDNKRLHLVELPMPGRIGLGKGDTDADRLPASYINFYIANKIVLVPVYSHQNDKPALKIIKNVFPDRKVVGIECTALVHGLGSIHCVTQQEPE